MSEKTGIGNKPTLNGDLGVIARYIESIRERKAVFSDSDEIPECPDDLNEENPGIRLTDLGNSYRFKNQHGYIIRYVHELGWLVWDGLRWKQDKTGDVMRLAKKTANAMFDEAGKLAARIKDVIKTIEKAMEANDEKLLKKAQEAKQAIEEHYNALLKHAIKTQARPRLEAMIELSKSEVPAPLSDFDTDPWILNCQNGILDLLNGELLPHEPKYRITKICGAIYDPDAKCPTWEKFLSRVFNENENLIRYIQKAVGYSLTGISKHQILIFCYGSGANGKSTFSNIIATLFGDYAMKTRAETFMVKRNDSIPEEVAQLVGVRFALAAELDEGQRLSESLTKDLTGGDKLRARHLYHDSFEFWPCAKLWLYGNHKPVIRGTDNGIWRRVQLIPFTVTIPKNEQDPDLPGKLKEELSGILNWALEGCVAWQKEGLEPPELVEAATNDYRAEQDVLAAFIDASCVIGQGKETKAADIYNAYKDWAVGNGEYCLSQRVFSQRLRERGFESSRKSNGVYYHGIGLLRPSNEG